MADVRPKGSIIYEILIVILAVVLIGSILYPKKLKEQQLEDIKISHYRMDQIQKAQLQYQKYNGNYNDTMSVVIDFIRNDPEYTHYIDSVVVGGLDSVLKKLDEFKMLEEEILALIPSAQDTTLTDSIVTMQRDMKYEARNLAGYVEYIHDKMKNLPNMPVESLTDAFLIIDSKEFTLNMDIVSNSVTNGKIQDATKGANELISVIDSIQEMIRGVIAEIPDYRNALLDSLLFCPTTGKPFEVVHIDSANSPIKYLNIYSPIDSADISKVNHDFLKSTIGGLKLTNHGKIEKGEKSWETQ